MKKTLALLFLLLCVRTTLLSGQSADPPPTLSPDGIFDKVFDRFGNAYSLEDVRVQKTEAPPKTGDNLATNPVVPSYLLCTAGYFNLYFEYGSGCETQAAADIDRRAVLCQLFTDLSAFIVPANPNVRVNIWVRDIGNVYTYPLTSNILGLASAFYTLPVVSPPASGILDGEIWKTINSGVDGYTGVSSPLITSGSSPGGSGAFYHGMIAFNFHHPSVIWHTDLTAATASGEIDLYTVALHEITHALGFASLIHEDGSSRLGSGFPFYSRYDLFLETPAGQNLITNSGCSMYDYTFNPALNPINTLSPNLGSCIPDNTVCSTAVNFAGAVNQAVYTPNCYESGSSLSHFEDQCASPTPHPNNQYYTMSNASGTGSLYMKRYLKPEERTVLCELGYKVNTTYGNLLYTANNYSYGGSQCSGLEIAGVNDGINSNGTFTWITPTATPVNISGSGLLGNDYNADEFECLEVINGMGSVNVSSGNGATTITFTPAGNTGVALLRYVPVNTTSGNRGNITYVLAYINSTNCIPSACNMIMNGDFESGVACGEPIPPDNASIHCWEPLLETPDLLVRNCFPPSNPDLTLPTGPSICSPASDSWNGTGNDGVLGLGWYPQGPGTVTEEAIQSILSTPIQPGVSYTLTFWAKSAYTGPFGFSQTNRIVFRGEASTLAPIAPYTYNTTGQYLTEAVVPDDQEWHFFSVEFTYNGTTPLNNLMIGNLGFGLANNGYVFMDDVTLNPTTLTTRFDLPPALCEGLTTIDDLSEYVFPPMNSGGSFSGPGVNYTAGVYSFSAPATGRYTLIYSYTNHLGCTENLPAQVNVTNANKPNVTVTSNPVTPPPVCAGTAVTLIADGAESYSWYSKYWPNATLYCSGDCKTIVVTPPVPGYVFTVTGTDANGCRNEAEISVLVEPCASGPGPSKNYQMPEDVKHYTTKMVPNTTNYSVMAGTIFRSGMAIPHFMYLNDQGSIITSVEYNSNDPDVRVVDLQVLIDGKAKNRWYMICQAAGKMKILVVDDNGNLIDEREYQGGGDLYPMHSAIRYVTDDRRLYVCGFKGALRYDLPKSAFVTWIDLDDGTPSYLSSMTSRTFDWLWGSGMDFDIATRIAITEGSMDIWVTGSVNGIVPSGQFGPPPPERSATMNLVLDPNTLTPIFDNPFILNTMSDNFGGPHEYGIDLIQINGQNYILGNMANVDVTAWNPGSQADMFPREWKMFFLQPLDANFDNNGTRFEYWNNWEHWGAQAIDMGGGEMAIVTLLNGTYRTCIPLPYTPAYNNVVVNLVGVDFNTYPPTPTGANGIFMTSSGTGDPLFVSNSFFDLGGAQTLIDYPPTFAALGQGRFVVNAPKYINGKLNLKYMSPGAQSFGVPCGFWTCENVFIERDVYDWGNPRVDVSFSITDHPGTSTGQPFVIPAPLTCHNTPGNPDYSSLEKNTDFRIYPNPASDKVTLELAGDILPGTEVRVELKNALGQQVTVLYQGKADPTISMHLPGIAPGLYFVQVYLAGDLVLKEKLIVEK